MSNCEGGRRGSGRYGRIILRLYDSNIKCVTSVSSWFGPRLKANKEWKSYVCVSDLSETFTKASLPRHLGHTFLFHVLRTRRRAIFDKIEKKYILHFPSSNNK